MPDFDANVLLVMSSYPGASAADIETNLTKVLENGLNGVSDLKDMTSKSKENISIITLEFNYGVDIEEATNNVRDKLDMINSSLLIRHLLQSSSSLVWMICLSLSFRKMLTRVFPD